MDEKKLLKYSIDYLSKYDSSKKNLIDVLKRKIFRLNIIGKEKNKLLNYIDNIIIRLEKNNLLSDKRYSLSKISSLSRTGKSKNFIFSYLIKKGINKNEIQINFEEFQQINKDWELDAAKLFAKKKKILESSDSYQKKLAKMARAGFSYDICKNVLN